MHIKMLAKVGAAAITLDKLCSDQSLSSAGLAEGTNVATIKVVTAFDYVCDGITYTKAITDNIAMTVCDEQAVSKACMYLVSINKTGTVQMTKGTEVATTIVPELPSCPSGFAPVASIKIVTDGVTTFTSGTTDLSAAGITKTIAQLYLTPAHMVNPAYGARPKLFPTYKVRSLGFQAVSGNAGSVYAGDAAMSSAVNGSPLSATDVRWASYGAMIGAQTDAGLFDLRKHAIHGDSVGDSVIIDVEG